MAENLTQNQIITIAGRKKMLRARAGEIQLPKIVGFVFGDGGVDADGNVIAPLEAESELKNELLRKKYDTYTMLSDTKCKYEWVDTPFDLSPPLTGGDFQNNISSPIRAQVNLPSLAPYFCTPFFDKNPPFSVFKNKNKNRRKYHKKSDKPPPAEPYSPTVRHKRFRCVGCRSPPSESLKTYPPFKLFGGNGYE